MSDFLGSVGADFAAICAGEFSETAIVSDGTESVTIRCLFDETSERFDTEANSTVIVAEPRITISEPAHPFNFRRAGLSVTVRGKSYKVRPSDWAADGFGALTLYLDKVRP